MGCLSTEGKLKFSKEIKTQLGNGVSTFRTSPTPLCRQRGFCC